MTASIRANHPAFVFVASVLVLMFVLLQAAGPVRGSWRHPCRITNVGSGQNHTGLQRAVDAARWGDRLAVEGKCHGGTLIDKSVVIVGIGTPADEGGCATGVAVRTAVQTRKPALRSRTESRFHAQIGGVAYGA
jgi:hypothetical protein